MKAYKSTPLPVVQPPTTYHVELTRDEYETIREACYQLHYVIETNYNKASWQDTACTLKDSESLNDVATRLYNTLPDAGNITEGTPPHG